MKGYPINYLVRWFWTSLLLASIILAFAYPVPLREASSWVLPLIAAGVVIAPWLVYPIMLVFAVVMILSATPAAFFLGVTTQPGLSGEQVCMMVGVIACIFLPNKAYPLWKNMWRADEDTQSLGPKDFWLTPLVLLGFVASAYLSGADPYFCLTLVGVVQGWQLWQALRLDYLAYKALPPDPSYEAPMGA